jgi:hypothetical protein
VPDIEADLRAFYDQEVAQRSARPLESERVNARGEFLALLARERRHLLLEVGTGAGQDGEAFTAAGHRLVGIDLSFVSARQSLSVGVPVAQASLLDLPFRPRCFEAGWSMSTLLHVPDSRFPEAMRSIVAAMEPGAPIAIGVWGGHDRETISDFDRIDPPRFFSLRSHARLIEMLSPHGTIEQFRTWPDTRSDWHYQFVVLRVP